MRYYPLTKAPKHGQPQVLFLPAEPKQDRIIESDTAKRKRKRFHKKKGKSPLASK
jgi:hypothetical protein